MTTSVKLSYTDETRRVALVDDQPLSFEALRSLVTATFPQAPRSVALVYTDEEGDLVTVTSTRELAEAQRVFALVLRKTMHVRVLPRVSVKDQLPPAVLHAVDELSSSLARLASGTRESFAHGGGVFLERSRASVAHSAKQTKEFFECARKEISQLLHDVHARIAGEIERRRSSVASAAARGVEDEGVEMETRFSEHFLPPSADASSGGDDEAEDSDDEVAAQVSEQSEVSAIAAEAAEQQDAAVPEAALPLADLQQQQVPEEEMLYASDAETVACSSSDEDDDSDDSDVEWAMVPDVWSAEVALVRTILPHVHVEDCVAMLRKHGGSLEAAIGELTDA